MTVQCLTYKTMFTFDKASTERPLSADDLREQSRLAAAPIAEAAATFERISLGASKPHPQVIRLLAERLVREHSEFIGVSWKDATSPVRLRETLQLVVMRALPTDIPEVVRTVALDVSRDFITRVNERHANTPARMIDYADTPVEAWAAFALYGNEGVSGYPAFLQTLDELTAKRPDLAAAVLARRDIRDHMLLAYVSGQDRSLIERLAKHTRAIAPFEGQF